ncbi:MFS transporter [Streptomyces anandii]|uniref:MFS transporter n=1 Tax=Streptomyces anandii TaxID=285454 RepID=UPI00167A0539|nr:MFS transporter [Streptomyces anandii]GGX81317.1 putative MFS-type transporter YceJ [Streptomyces anandii JCM 4720]
MTSTSRLPSAPAALAPETTVAPSPRTVSLLAFATMFVIGTDTFLVAPLLPTLTRTFDVSSDVSGWMVSAYALGYAVFALIAGPLSDGRDRRRVLLTGLVGFVVMTTLCGFAQGFWTMLLFRFLAGVSAAFVSPQIWASIPVLVGPQEIVRTMGFATAGLSIAQFAGIPLGSWLAADSWHLPFWVIGGSSVLLWLLLARFFPSVPGRPGAGTGARALLGTYATVFGRGRLRWYLLGYLVFQTGSFEAMSFYGSWFTNDFGLSVGSVGTAMMAVGAGNVVGSLFGSRLVQRLGLYRSLLMAVPAVAALYCLVPLSPNLGTALVLLALVMMAGGFLFPVFMSILQQQTETARGTVSSLANSAMYVGTTVGGAVGGVLLSNVDGFWGVAVFTVAAQLVSLAVYAAAGAFRVREAGA